MLALLNFRNYVIIGIIIAAWPDKDPERVAVRVDKQLKQTSAAD